MAQDNVEGIDAVNSLRVHVDVDILEEVLKASRVQLGNTLDHGLGRLPLPCALNKVLKLRSDFLLVTFPAKRGPPSGKMSCCVV